MTPCELKCAVRYTLEFEHLENQEQKLMIYVPFIFPYWLNVENILTHWAKYNLLLKFISHVPFYLFCNVATRKVLIVCVVHIIFSFDSAALESVMLEFWFCWFCFVCGLLSVVMKV